ncbi:Hypothetical predicted protein, partial [Olea europaea subsp. europaea]
MGKQNTPSGVPKINATNEEQKKQKSEVKNLACNAMCETDVILGSIVLNRSNSWTHERQ